LYDPKTLKQSKPTLAVIPKDSPAVLAIVPHTVPAQHRIRARAYELYESRGREPGQDEQDWFRAERELLKQER
jgi:hypothetical protein